MKEESRKFRLEFYMYTDKVKYMYAEKELSPNIVSKDDIPESDWEPFKNIKKWLNLK